MKPVIVVFSIVMGTLLLSAEKKDDPFQPPSQVEVDRGNDQTSSAFLTDDLLKATGEPRLDKGSGKGGPGLIRITILRSFNAPLVFTWFPEGREQEPSLQVKRVKVETDDIGNRAYAGMDVNTRVILRPPQNENLKTLFQKADFDGLPQDCWQTGSLDGSLWIYERAAEDGWTLIVRHNPIDPQVEEQSPVSKRQLVKESNLTTFALMIWTLSGLDESSIY